MKPMVPGRLAAQALAAPPFESGAQAVRHLGCVQSQLFDMALWAVARRTRHATLASLQAEFDRGEFLRTHILRPTWHFVDVADIHWLLSLTAPRIRRLIAASVNGRHPDELLERSAEVVVAALADGTARTRAELGLALGEAGLPSAGQPMADLIMNAEISALIVNGPMLGKQHSYRLLEPRRVTETRDELLAKVARRYAAGHGPYRDKDLAWWSGLTLTDSRRAISLGELQPLDVGEVAHWTVDPPIDVPVPRATLLANFDEYISYARDPEDYAQLGVPAEIAMRCSGLLLLEGRLAGTWARSLSTTRVKITVTTGGPLTSAARRAIEAEAQAFGLFVDREPDLLITG